MANVPRRVTFDGRQWWLWPLQVGDMLGIVEHVRSDLVAAALRAAPPGERARVMREAIGAAAATLHMGSPDFVMAMSDPVMQARMVWAVARLGAGAAAPEARPPQTVEFERFIEILATDPDGLMEAWAAVVASCGFLRRDGGGSEPQGGSDARAGRGAGGEVRVPPGGDLPADA